LDNKRIIKIDQAYYGEVNRSHGCIASSKIDQNLHSFLTGFSDKPSRMPVGIELNIYYLATTYNNNFIFTKTIPNPAAIRPGMVFTHALIFSVDDAENINDLNELFALFISSIPSDSSLLTAIELAVVDSKILKNNIPAFIQRTTKFLIKDIKVAYFGTVASFITTIVLIWNGLPPKLRKNFIFYIGFTAADIENSKYPITYYQKILSNKIDIPGKVTDDENLEITVVDSVEKLVLGGVDSDDLKNFITVLNIELNDFKQLSIIDKAFNLTNSINQLDADETRQLIRLISKLSPSALDAKELKEVLINRLEAFIALGKDYQIKALRNIDFRGFPDLIVRLAKCIENFIINQFDQKFNFEAEQIIELINLIFDNSIVTWWSSAVKKGLIGGFASKKGISSIWKIILGEGAKSQHLLILLEEAKTSEDSLILTLPQITKDQAKHAASFFLLKKWYMLYANMNFIFLDADAALEEQLKAEAKFSLSISNGVKFLAAKLPDDQLLTFDLNHKNNKTLILYTERIIKDVKLLAKIDLTNSRWLTIWNEYIVKTNRFEQGISDIHVLTYQLFQLISNGTIIPDKIIDLYSQSKFADLSEYEQRQDFWLNVPHAYKDRFIQATAKIYAEKIADGLVSVNKFESDISNVLKTNSFISLFLSSHRNEIEKVLSLFEYLHLQNDEYLAGYINFYQNEINAVSSSRLGTFVMDNKFEKTAQAIFNKSKSTKSFRIALTTCRQLISLGTFDRIIYAKLFGETLSDQMAYDGLFELVKQLYPKGPEDNDIWERAGGDNSKLVNFNSREENWRKAVHLARYGGGGKNINITSLMSTIKKEFPGNPVVNELINYFK